MVRHGRVLLDNGDCLPCDQRYDKPKSNDRRWIPLRNGHYRVVVHKIDWTEAPGALDEDNKPTADSLPSFVLRFVRVRDIYTIPVRSDTPPWLANRRGTPPLPGKSKTEYETFEQVRGPLPQAPLLLVETDRWLVIPGFHEFVQVSKSLSG